MNCDRANLRRCSYTHIGAEQPNAGGDDIVHLHLLKIPSTALLIVTSCGVTWMIRALITACLLKLPVQLKTAFEWKNSNYSCASLLLNNGCGLKDVQEWMGHSDIQTTANIYGHLDTSRKQSLADKLTKCLHERR